MNTNTHEIVLGTPALVPEEGFLLGNGDLSVSVYQGVDELRFRLGKGDVWDRRLNFSRDPKPAHIQEVARGILEEGWTCGAYGGPVKAAKGDAADPARMREICQGCPPSYHEYPFPCPKPVAELAVRFPGDLPGLEVTQRLIIETGRLEVTCRWRNGACLKVAAVVHPEINRLSLRWQLDGWEGGNRYGGQFAGLPEPLPVWFSLYRRADPEIGVFARRHANASRHPGFTGYAKGGAPPLPPPELVTVGERPVLLQRFPEDTLFPGGFACAAAAGGAGLTARPAEAGPEGAAIHLLPASAALTGELTVAVATSGDLEHPGPDALGVSEAAAAARMVTATENAGFARDADAAARAASGFWGQSRVRLGDAFLENLWYSTLHAKRCVLRRGKVPPGLFLPSTLRDYGLWHGDYHTNYNLQSIFLGDYTANHAELGDAYFTAIQYFLEIGRKIARDYYGCRGAFIQLTGYATHPQEDPIGTVPMGRMAYMTGWVAAHYFSRWRHTLDRAWLEQQGYPVVRDLALFYTDFLKKGDDRLYHAFPSNQGEDGFTGAAKPYTDRAQVMRHVRYCLQAALEMAAVLEADASLQTEWRERLTFLAPEDGDPDRQRRVTPDERFRCLAPEFLGFDGTLPPRDPARPPAFLQPGHEFHDWYPGKIPYEWSTHLRNGAWEPARDWPALKALLERWVHPNGLLWAMALANYGRLGGWTESLGIIGAIQDLLMQSWSGVIELFPGWPRHLDAAFETLRAEGAFLVTAAWQGGRVTSVEIISEAGAACALRNPWPGRAVMIHEVETGTAHPIQEEEGGSFCFPTRSGHRYRLIPRMPPGVEGESITVDHRRGPSISVERVDGHRRLSTVIDGYRRLLYTFRTPLHSG